MTVPPCNASVQGRMNSRQYPNEKYACMRCNERVLNVRHPQVYSKSQPIFNLSRDDHEIDVSAVCCNFQALPTLRR